MTSLMRPATVEASTPDIPSANLTAGATSPRDGYLDLLRAAALIGVVIYQWFGWGWTPSVIPFTAITFAVAGSLIAAALDRSPAFPWTVLARRARRIVLPVWGLAAVVIVLMVRHGSAAVAGPGSGSLSEWANMLLWVVPLFEPPTSAWAAAWTGSMWFVPAYLWLTLLSPPLLWSFRRWPLRTIALPVVGLVLALTDVWNPTGRFGEVLLNFALFGGCWLIGFAFHDNQIARMSSVRVLLLALVLMTAGLIGTARAGDMTAAHIADLPLANSVWGAGLVILLLRLHRNPVSWFRRSRLGTVLAALQGRAMTIFLWSFPAFLLAAEVKARYASRPDSAVTSGIQQIGLTLGLVALAVILLGWLEDLGIGRSPRVNPFALRERVGRAERRRKAALTAWPLIGAAGAIMVAVLVFPAGSAPLAAHPRTALPAGPGTSPADEATADSDLPPGRVVAGYWHSWGEPSLRLRNVPKAYNLVLAAFATGDATGKVSFSQSVQSKSSFVEDVDELNRAGRPVLLSVGGWDDGGLKITTDAQRRAFIRSVSKIIDANHFRGIDWDLEHGIDPVQVAKATHELTSRYGPEFLVTMAPLLERKLEAEQLELAARIADVLDLASPQFYNNGNMNPSWIVDRTMVWASILGQDKVAMGFMTVDTPTDTGERRPKEVCRIWRQLLAKAPSARGVSTWSINLDKRSGYDLAEECAVEVRDWRSPDRPATGLRR